MSSRLNPVTGEVTITSADYCWCEPGHRLAVVGSPAEAGHWAAEDARLGLLLEANEGGLPPQQEPAASTGLVPALGTLDDAQLGAGPGLQLLEQRH
jgi:hypothetical protein